MVDRISQSQAEAVCRPVPDGVLHKQGSPFKFTLMMAEGLFATDVVVTGAVRANPKAVGRDVQSRSDPANSR